MAINLAINVKKALIGFPVTTIQCWSDSSVVLHWLTGSGEYKQFVSNRVNKINEHQEVLWRHVPSASNPADLASRGGRVNESTMWWHGPEWLSNEELWPEDIVPEPSEESNAEAKAVKQVFAVAVNQENEIDGVLKKFSLQKAVRVCAWIRRFAHNSLRSRGKSRIKGPLTTDETQRQRQFWIKQAQENCDLEQDRVALNLQPRKDAVWRRGRHEYLRNLRERHRTKAGHRGALPAVGDVVIISTDEKKRGKWPLGVVEELITGKDGKVRGAKVRTDKSQLERAVQQLYPLELACDKEEPVAVPLNPEAMTFRPKRDAAVAAQLRVQEITEGEKE